MALEDLQKDVEDLAAKLKSFKEADEGNIAAYNAKIKDLDARHTDLKSKIDDLQAVLDTAFKEREAALAKGQADLDAMANQMESDRGSLHAKILAADEAQESMVQAKSDFQDYAEARTKTMDEREAALDAKDNGISMRETKSVSREKESIDKLAEAYETARQADAIKGDYLQKNRVLKDLLDEQQIKDQSMNTQTEAINVQRAEASGIMQEALKTQSQAQQLMDRANAGLVELANAKEKFNQEKIAFLSEQRTLSDNNQLNRNIVDDGFRQLGFAKDEFNKKQQELQDFQASLLKLSNELKSQQTAIDAGAKEVIQ